MEVILLYFVKVKNQMIWGDFINSLFDIFWQIGTILFVIATVAIVVRAVRKKNDH